jgi:MFS family permease
LFVTIIEIFFLKMRKIYTGWWILLALSLIYVASNGFGINTIPVFYPGISKDFGLTKGDITQAPSLMYLGIAILSPIFGYLFDRFSAKNLLLLAGIWMALLFWFFASIQNLQHLLGYYGAYALGLSMGGVIPSIFLISRWFKKRRGLAVGIFLNASSIGASILSPIAGQLSQARGWREAAATLAWPAIALLLLPQLLIKNTPSKTERIYEFDIPNTPEILEGITIGRAIKQRDFYVLLITTASLWFCINGILFNKDLYLNDLQLDTAQAGRFGGLFFFCSIIGKLFFGWLSDILDKKKVMFFSVACLTLGAILLRLSLQNTQLLIAVAIAFGAGYSGAFTMIQLLIADYYAGKSYGTILGVFTMIDTLAGSLGIGLIGKFRAMYGTYEIPFTIMVVLCVSALLTLLLVRKPRVKGTLTTTS